MIVLACILSVFLLYITYSTADSYQAMRDTTETYIESQTKAADLRAGSDYLTEQVRAFVVTGDTDYLNNYFEEANVTRRRDRAVETLNEYLSGTDTHRYLETALSYSNELMELEYYAMRLAIEAFGYDPAQFPEEVAGIELTDEDLALAPEAKKERARMLVFDETYQGYKEKIYTNVSLCLETLIGETRRQQLESSSRLLDLLHFQGLFTCVLLIIVFAVIVMTSQLIIQPLRKSIAHIQEQEPLPLLGSYELRFLARTYNEMFERTQQEQNKLSYEASHDVLTGLYNRSAFEKLRHSSDERDIAMLLIDLDKFKEINDTYGHDTGDAILKKAAAILRASFRSEDLVCRIGGDEFAVIMLHASSELSGLVRRKIGSANEKLMNPDDGLPPISISVGVAFGDRREPTEDIFKDADTALYKVKENGRCGCAFYGES